MTRGGLRLALPVETADDDLVCVGVRAEDVLLAMDAPGRISARNVLGARVTRCEASGGDCFVYLDLDDAGETLVAKVTADAARKLGIGPGAAVHAIVKAQAIRRLA